MTTPQQPYQQPYQQPPQQPQQPQYQQPQYQQQPYAQQPYPQQPYPAYAGAPGGYGAQPAARPGMVTGAAVLAFIWGGLAIIGALISMLAGGFVASVGTACETSGLDANTAAACNDVSGAGGFLITVGIALIIVAALLIWGGVVALSGKSGQIVVIACGILVLLEIASLIASGSVTFSVVGIIVPILIIVFMLNPQSKAWIKSRGGKTF